MSEINPISLAEFSRLYLQERSLVADGFAGDKPQTSSESFRNNLAAHIVLGMSKAAVILASVPESGSKE